MIGTHRQPIWCVGREYRSLRGRTFEDAAAGAVADNNQAIASPPGPRGQTPPAPVASNTALASRMIRGPRDVVIRPYSIRPQIINDGMRIVMGHGGERWPSLAIPCSWLRLVEQPAMFTVEVFAALTRRKSHDTHGDSRSHRVDEVRD